MLVNVAMITPLKPLKTPNKDTTAVEHKARGDWSGQM